MMRKHSTFTPQTYRCIPVKAHLNCTYRLTDISAVKLDFLKYEAMNLTIDDLICTEERLLTSQGVFKGF